MLKTEAMAKSPILEGSSVESTGRLVGYARVSTSDQNLEMQIAALERAGVRPENIHSEQVSGVARRRPGLDLAIKDCRAGDTFVVWKLDRMGRSLADLIERVKQLEKMEVGFRSLTESIDTTTPGGRLIMHVMASLAQFERDLVVERTRAGVKAARERGVRFGHPRTFEGKKLEKATEMLRNGASVRQIASHFKCATATVYNYFPRTVILGIRGVKPNPKKSK